jgi:hypothetical protein
MKINEEASPKNVAESERITCHMQIGTTIGPCWFVSGIILLLDALLCKKSCGFGGFAITVLLISVGLMILGRIKLVQLQIFTTKLYEDLNGNDQQETPIENTQLNNTHQVEFVV